MDGDFVPLDSILSADDTVYNHYNQGYITGCYAVIAVDSVGNQSDFSNTVCIDYEACPEQIYKLPNVFSPNNDGYNDMLKPYPYTSVDHVKMLIFNRWGNLVYETEDPDINWDGKNMKNGAECSQGTYFYTCDVFEVTLQGIRERLLRGSITLLR